MNQIQQITARGRAWWVELAPREQRLIAIGVVALALLLFWWVAVAPALRTLAGAPAEHARLDGELQQMSALQAQARALQAQPRASRDDALRALENSVRQSLGSEAQLQPTGAGDAIGLTVRGAPATALSEWLAQARGNARAVPREVHLTRSQTPAAEPSPAPGRRPNTAAKDNAAPPVVRWDGTLIVSLPASR